MDPSDLPRDVLSDIMSRLHIRDAASFRSAQPGAPPNDRIAKVERAFLLMLTAGYRCKAIVQKLVKNTNMSLDLWYPRGVTVFIEDNDISVTDNRNPQDFKEHSYTITNTGVILDKSKQPLQRPIACLPAPGRGDDHGAKVKVHGTVFNNWQKEIKWKLESHSGEWIRSRQWERVFDVAPSIGVMLDAAVGEFLRSVKSFMITMHDLQGGGAPHNNNNKVRVLGRERKIIMRGRTPYVTYNKQLIKLSAAVVLDAKRKL